MRTQPVLFDPAKTKIGLWFERYQYDGVKDPRTINGYHHQGRSDNLVGMQVCAKKSEIYFKERSKEIQRPSAMER